MWTLFVSTILAPSTGTHSWISGLHPGGDRRYAELFIAEASRLGVKRGRPEIETDHPSQLAAPDEDGQADLRPDPERRKQVSDPTSRPGPEG